MSGHNQTDKYTDGQTGIQRKKSERGTERKAEAIYERERKRKNNQASDVQACGKRNQNAYRSELREVALMRIIKNFMAILNELLGGRKRQIDIEIQLTLGV